MPEDTQQSTDDIIRDALNEESISNLKKLEKSLVERMLPNTQYLGSRVDSAIATIERKINYHYQQKNAQTNRLIAYAAILTAIVGAIFGYWQNLNTQRQILQQGKQKTCATQESSSLLRPGCLRQTLLRHC
jgi:hypothetical protein